ncbi:uncharacterized protein JCM15063_003119 [Sporobolomyces koalae]|uniref:uncharacterized protein n=1 Tax=Sporobolomyces koalae TaxID=500713 RepID=UPI003179F8E1
MSSSELDHEKAGGDSSVHYLEEVAEAGHVATDKYGNALISIDEAAEARLRRKLDLILLPPVSLIYLFCFIDRANIGNARLAGLEKNLKLVGYDYNILLTAFYVAYVVGEMPAQWLNKRLGVGRMIAAWCFLFGLFSFVMTFVHSMGAAIAVRFLLGLAEGGVFPGIALYLSRYYRNSELVFRLALYVVCAPAAGAFGGLLASGILRIDSFHSTERWRNIFFIEGLITMGIAVGSYFVLSDDPQKAKWLNEEEKALAAARVKMDNVGMPKVIDSLSTKAMLDGIRNPTTLIASLIFLLDNITVQGLGFFLPTVIRTLFPGKTTIALQLRTVPPYVVGMFFTLAVPFVSWKSNRRLVFMIGSAVPMMVGYVMFVASTNVHVKYAASFIIAMGAFSFGPFCTAVVAINSTSDTAKASALGTCVLFGNLGGLIATWVFLPNDAPRYLRANGINLGTSSGIFILSILLLVYQMRQNKQKEAGHDDHLLDGKTADEIAVLGQKHPGFRFKL